MTITGIVSTTLWVMFVLGVYRGDVSEIKLASVAICASIFGAAFAIIRKLDRDTALTIKSKALL